MWYQLEIQCLRHQADTLSDELEQFGALSVAFLDKNDDPILEPEIGTTPLWPEVIIHALFDDETEALLVKKAFRVAHPDLKIKTNQLEDENWQQRCMDSFQPQQFGQRLWVCPSWQQPPDPLAITIKLDPGLAFGTGTHPTTHLCLTWLEQAEMTNKHVIDYGCGSGILAVAAALLGARSVCAVDIDPQALTATRYNAENNGFNDQQIQIDFPHKLNTKADILIANILLTPLIELELQFKELLSDEGILVVSGILATQVDELIKQYDVFTPVKQYYLEDWALIVFKLK